MTPIQKLSNRNNYGSTRNINNIKYLIIHYTANDGDSARGNANYFANGIIGASAHYFVDDTTIYQSVPDNYIAWAVGDKKWANTKGAKWYNICTNANSISIELCDTVKNGKYDFTEATLQNAAELAASIMIKYNIPIENLGRHYDVSGKICPKPMVEDEAKWEDFKNRIRGEIMIQKLISKYGEAAVEAALEKLIKTEIEKNNIPDWAKAELEIAKAKGLTDGTRMGDYATRLEVALIANRVK